MQGSESGRLFFLNTDGVVRVKPTYTVADDEKIASPTKSQWQSARAAYLEGQNQDPDGWIEWHGGYQPVPDDVLVAVKIGHDVEVINYAGNQDWDNKHITHYRLHREEKTLTECLCDEVEESIKKAYKRPPMPKEDPNKEMRRMDNRSFSPQEEDYAFKKGVERWHKKAEEDAEAERYEQHTANVLKTADTHAYLLGVGQYREGE